MAETTQVFPTPSVITTPTAQEVYSSANVSSALSNPVSAPDLSDPYGLYDYYMNSAEIKAAKEQVSGFQNQINQTNQALRTTTTALQNQNAAAQGTTGASINLIGKQVGRARELTSNELSALGENYNAAVANLNTYQTDASNRYQIAQGERSLLQSLITSTGGKAGISYTDSYEKALKKATDYTKKQSEKDAIKELYMNTFGSSGKGLSTKEMEKKLKKSAKSTKEYEKQVKSLSLQTSQLNLQKLQTEINKLKEANTYNPANAYSNSSNSSAGSGTDQSPFSSIYG